MRPLIAFSLTLLFLLSIPFIVIADLSASELALNPDGTAYEVHPDSQGRLWISEYLAGEVWRVDSTNTVNVYPVGGAPSDATPDTSNAVWWVDGATIRRLDLSSNTVETWTVPIENTFLYGVTVDSNGDIWLTDPNFGTINRFQRNSRQFCAYSLPDNGMSLYPTVSGQNPWLADSYNMRILRLDPNLSAPNFTVWQLPAEISAGDAILLDASNNAWFTDPNHSALARLEPAANPNQVTRYSFPTGINTQPKMLANTGGRIWFSGQSPAAVGALDPTTATASFSQAITPTTSTAALACQNLAVPTTSQAAPRQVTPSWTDGTYTTLAASAGWAIYQLPASANPLGIAAITSIHVVDSARQKLLKFVPPSPLQISITACVRQDRDSNLSTTGDQAPLPGWELTLLGNGSEISKKTSSAAGCAAWNQLEAGPTYSVHLTPQSGWQEISGSANPFSFGTSSPGATYQHTFYQWRNLRYIYIPMVLK